MTIMTQSISAAIHIQGPTLRYAELEQDDSALHLRRLGQEAFGFDVPRVFWGEEGPDALDQVGAVAREALGDTEASAIRLVVHSLDVYSFFTPVPTGLSEQERGQRVEHEAALVTNTRSPNSLYTTFRAVCTVVARGETLEWVHVLAMPQTVEERLQVLTAALPVQDPVQMTSAEAVAWLMGDGGMAQPRSAENEGAYWLAMGQYPSYTEYALTHKGTWYHAHTAQESRSPENRAYFAVGLLNRIDVPLSEVRRLSVYGPDADPGPNALFESIFDCSPTLLDPAKIFPRIPELSREEAPGAYLPCIGGALAAQPA